MYLYNDMAFVFYVRNIGSCAVQTLTKRILLKINNPYFPIFGATIKLYICSTKIKFSIKCLRFTIPRPMRPLP